MGLKLGSNTEDSKKILCWSTCSGKKKGKQKTLDKYKFTGTDETHPKAPRSWLAPTQGYFLSALKSYRHQGMSLTTSSAKNARMIWGLLAGQFIHSPRIFLDESSQKLISRHTKGIGSSQHKWTRRKLHQINMATFLWGWRESWGCHLVWLQSLLTVPSNTFLARSGNNGGVEEQLAGLPGSMAFQNVTNCLLRGWY